MSVFKCPTCGCEVEVVVMDDEGFWSNDHAEVVCRKCKIDMPEVFE